MIRIVFNSTNSGLIAIAIVLLLPLLSQKHLTGPEFTGLFIILFTRKDLPFLFPAAIISIFHFVDHRQLFKQFGTTLNFLHAS